MQATKITIAAMMACCIVAPSPAQENALSEISFNRDIRPILSDKCFHCHGPDEHSRETDLRFDDKESALSDLGGYHAIVPGDVEESELVRRIVSDDESEKMPPDETGKPLTQIQIDLLKQWISSGARWDEFWAYVPPKKSAMPKVKNEAWTKNWIDHFVLAQLEKNSLSPNKPADKVPLLRRIHFDLTGLPPTPADVALFLADDSDNAFAKVVDRLLKSPHFGERMAIYWLDLVRYADTVGYHGDQDHNISPYRDWVINAFNDNMPFDQFTREQLAGDLLPDASLDQRIASGYNRLLQTTHEGGLQPKEYTTIYQADRVRNVSLVWMGATVGCAQCHDHKYDPYTTKDFYSLAAFFSDVDDEKHFKSGTNALPTKRPPEELIIGDKERKKLDQLGDELKLLAASKKDSDKRLGQLKKELKKEETDALLSEKKHHESKVAGLNSQIKSLQQQIKIVESKGTWTMVTQRLATRRTTRVLPRGNWLDETGEIVSPAIPAFMGKVSYKSIKAPHETAKQTASRLDLARWLTDGDTSSGKLTARVMANRLWYLMMGVGVSRSLDDFGGQGFAPSNPNLLDNLAIEFIQSNWNVKKLIRQICLSNTYQQSTSTTDALASADPYNELFARQSKYRLPAEVIRDNALAVSGLLNVSQVGGKSIKPYQPAGYYQHLNFPTRKYKHDSTDDQWRRGVYIHWQRQFLHPTLKALDAPTREECTAERPRSNTPLAALALLNDPTFVEAAKHFAIRVQSAQPDNIEKQIEYAFLLALARKPATNELEILSKLYEMALLEFRNDPQRVQELLKVGDAPIDADTFNSETAALTTITRAILNLDEVITRN